MSIVDVENTIAKRKNAGWPVATLPRATYGHGLKRVFDFCFAVLVLPFVAPLLLVLSLLVRRDGGKGFFSQPRIGRDGRVFQCWKLRTMVVNADEALEKLCLSDPEIEAEWQKNQKLKDDPRITKIGRFLRATSLDELPQIWNILLGDMSFVGPRPFMENQDSLYQRAGGKMYYQVRPGITGPWQVFGRGTTTFVDRVKYDNVYCRKVTFARDMLYIVKTFGVVMRRTGH